MMSLPVWLPGPMFLLGGSMSLASCSFQGGLCLGGDLSRGYVSRRGFLVENTVLIRITWKD